jgi:hypothetical protein
MPMPIPALPRYLLPWHRETPRVVAAGGEETGVTVVEMLGDETAEALVNALAKSCNFLIYSGGESRLMPVRDGVLRVVIAEQEDPLFVDALMHLLETQAAVLADHHGRLH